MLHKVFLYNLVLLFYLFLRVSLCFAEIGTDSEISKADKSAFPILKFDPTGSSNWYPYYIDDTTGIVTELASLILSEANIQGEKVNLPPKRTNKSLDQGLIDFDFINPDWLSEKNKSQQYIFSDKIIPIKEYIIYLAATSPPKKMNKVQDIKMNLGTVRGYYYHDDELFNRVDYPSEKSLILALKYKRIKYAICGDKPALHWAKELSVSLTLGAIHSDGYLHIRIRKEYAPLLRQINQAIKKLHRNGTIKSIIASY